MCSDALHTGLHVDVAKQQMFHQVPEKVRCFSNFDIRHGSEGGVWSAHTGAVFIRSFGLLLRRWSTKFAALLLYGVVDFARLFLRAMGWRGRPALSLTYWVGFSAYCSYEEGLKRNVVVLSRPLQQAFTEIDKRLTFYSGGVEGHPLFGAHDDDTQHFYMSVLAFLPSSFVHHTIAQALIEAFNSFDKGLCARQEQVCVRDWFCLVCVDRS